MKKKGIVVYNPSEASAKTFVGKNPIFLDKKDGEFTMEQLLEIAQDLTEAAVAVGASEEELAQVNVKNVMKIIQPPQRLKNLVYTCLYLSKLVSTKAKAKIFAVGHNVNEQSTFPLTKPTHFGMLDLE